MVFNLFDRSETVVNYLKQVKDPDTQLEVKKGWFGRFVVIKDTEGLEIASYYFSKLANSLQEKSNELDMDQDVIHKIVSLKLESDKMDSARTILQTIQQNLSSKNGVTTKPESTTDSALIQKQKTLEESPGGKFFKYQNHIQENATLENIQKELYQFTKETNAIIYISRQPGTSPMIGFFGSREAIDIVKGRLQFYFGLGVKFIKTQLSKNGETFILSKHQSRKLIGVNKDSFIETMDQLEPVLKEKSSHFTTLNDFEKTDVIQLFNQINSLYKQTSTGGGGASSEIYLEQTSIMIRAGGHTRTHLDAVDLRMKESRPSKFLNACQKKSEQSFVAGVGLNPSRGSEFTPELRRKLNIIEDVLNYRHNKISKLTNQSQIVAITPELFKESLEKVLELYQTHRVYYPVNDVS